MISPRRCTLGATAVLCLVLLAPHASATVVLGFEGLQDCEQILQFYNGGLGGYGSGPGPDYGISFGADALALIDADAGGTGNFANEPSPDNIAFFLTGPGVIMDVPAGFSTGFSFYYTNIYNPGSVDVWDGLNASGTLLASLYLPALGSSGNGDPTGAYDTWAPVGVAFPGSAKSVNFSGSANYIGFDNVTLGSQTPSPGVPEPTSIALLALAAGGIGATLRKRRRQ